MFYFNTLSIIIDLFIHISVSFRSNTFFFGVPSNNLFRSCWSL